MKSVVTLVVLQACLFAASSSAQPVTYATNIAPLIADRCGMCHHPGGSAPFSLLSYADVKRRASLIGAVTARRYMPPWKADPSNGPFIGQHPLSDDEIGLIRRWIESGAAEGDPRDLPTPASWIEGWQLGKPDLIVTL